MNEVIATLRYIVTIEILGIWVFPLSHMLFKKFPDKGWGFSKIIGILIPAYVTWLLSSLKIILFDYQNSMITALIVGILIWIFFVRRIDFKSLPSAIKFIFVEEFLFLLVLVGWTYVRGYAPDTNGLEKFMDYGFMLSILKTPYFPPLDHFLAGETINYYYFGHYLAAYLSRLAQVPANFGFNLQMSAIFALSAIQAFALGSGLFYLINNNSEKVRKLPWRSFGSGILAFLFISVFGNLHTVIYYFQDPTKYWYPDATRFIYNTIHEFPIYSFIVNDLHGHVSDIPIVILGLAIIALIILSFKQKENRILSTHEFVQSLPLIAFLSFCIGTMYATNAWDFAIYLVVSGTMFWTLFASQTKYDSWIDKYFNKNTIINTAIHSVALVLLAIIFYLPFWQNLTPISKGIGIVPINGHSPIWQIAILWGVQVPLAFFFTLWLKNQFTPERKNFKEKIVAWFSKLLSVSITFQKKIGPQKQEDQLQNSLSIGNFQIDRFYVYLAILSLISFILIILPEIIFIRDIYPSHYRANTMFKFYYQAWIMLGIVSGVSVFSLWHYYNRHRLALGKIYQVISILLIISAAIYPIEAIGQAFGEFKGTRTSIDGTSYLSKRYVYDAQAINWINTNLSGQPTILEAVGDSYTDYARISSNTGNPTVLGWPVHEWLWRGDYSLPMKPETRVQKETGTTDSVGIRTEEVKQMYETESLETTRNLLSKYHVDYVYVGDMEREKYSDIQVDKFYDLGTVVYENSHVVLFKIVE